MRILLISGSTPPSDIQPFLDSNKFIVTVAHGVEEVQTLMILNSYNIIVLDESVPGAGSADLFATLRNENIHIPILLVTSLKNIDNNMDDTIGCDDFILRPFEAKELVRRINALHSRQTYLDHPHRVLRLHDLEMNLETKMVTRGGKIISLTSKEYSLLEYLLKNKERVVSRTEISEKVWNTSLQKNNNIVDVYINFLRRKIDKHPEIKLINTVIGMGYIVRKVHLVEDKK